MKRTWNLTGLAVKAWGLIQKYKFILLVIFAGVVLLLLPTGGEREADQRASDSTAENFSVENMERRLEKALSQVKNAGDVTVVLTVRSGTRQILAQDTKTSSQENSADTVIVSKGSGTEDPVVLQQVYPQYQGALVVCPGAGEPAVRLKLVEAVSALTGLGANKISVCISK